MPELTFTTGSMILVSSISSLGNGIVLLISGGMGKKRSGVMMGGSFITMAAALLLFTYLSPINPAVSRIFSALLLMASFFMLDQTFRVFFIGAHDGYIPLAYIAVCLLGIIPEDLAWFSFALRSSITTFAILFTLARLGLLINKIIRRLNESYFIIYTLATLVIAVLLIFRLVYIFNIPSLTSIIQESRANNTLYWCLLIINTIAISGYFENNRFHDELERSTIRDRESIVLDLQRYLNRIISHDLNGPFGSLNNILREMKHDYDQGTVPTQEMVDVLAEVGHSSQKLLRNVSDLGKYQLGRARQEPGELVLASVLWSALEGVEPEKVVGKLEIIQEMDENLISIAEPQALDSVIRNILWFFIEHSPENEYILLQARSNRIDPGLGHISVISQKAELSPEKLEALNHSELKELELSSKRQNAETIGIMLIQTICRQYHWDVEFKPHLDGGTRCDLLIPLKAEQSKKAQST